MSEALERIEGETRLTRTNEGNQEKRNPFHKKKDHFINAVSTQPNPSTATATTSTQQLLISLRSLRHALNRTIIKCRQLNQFIHK